MSNENKPKNDREFGQMAGAVYEQIFFDKMDIDDFITWLFNYSNEMYEKGKTDK